MPKLPRIYYGYKKLREIWARQPDSEDKKVMIESLDESLKEIIEQHMVDFEKKLYEEKYE
jgi:hypothetical protein